MERTILSWSLPESHYVPHWIRTFWPQTLMAYLLAGVLATIVFTITFGSASIADLFLVYGTILVLILLEIAGITLYHHLSGSTVNTTITSHGIHVVIKRRTRKHAHFAAWNHIHSVHFRPKHRAAILVHHAHRMSRPMLILAPSRVYNQARNVLQRYCKRVI